jgi:hypothetical protein
MAGARKLPQTHQSVNGFLESLPGTQYEDFSPKRRKRMSLLGELRNRKNNTWRLAIASAVIALSTGALSPAARADNEGPNGSAPIEGPWILTIHRVSQGITFSALQSCNAGGVTLATGTIDRTPPPPISPLYGSWTRVAPNNYVATICFFVFDPAGNAVAMIKTPETFQLVNNNSLTGSGKGLACDLNGDNCVDVSLPVTITGKRLIPQGASN